MKIGFLLGFPEISGGTYVIFEHAVGLIRLGHDVSIITEDYVDPQRYSWHESAQLINWVTFRETIDCDYDFAIGTWWRSTLDLARIKAKFYVYFVQSIETKFFGNEDSLSVDQKACKNLCEKTYFFNTSYITEATWIKEYLKSEFGHDAYLVRNGIRKDLYDIKIDEQNRNNFRVLIEGALGVPFKNVDRTIELVKQSEADEIWLLTPTKLDEYDGVDKVFSQIPINEVSSIYSDCDILVKLSYVEGMFGPPLEMFHCGGTSIVYDVTGHDEYIVNGVNSIVIKTDDESEVINAINLLKDNREYCDDLKKGAMKTANDWPSWSESAKCFEAALCDIASNCEQNLLYIGKYTKSLWEDYRRDLEYYSHSLYFDDSSVKDELEIFIKENGVYSGENKYHHEFNRNSRNLLNIEIDNLEETQEIRIDPSASVGFIKVFDIRIYKESVLLFSLNERFNLESIRVLGTADLWAVDGGDILIHSNGNDPSVFLKIGTMLKKESYQVEIDFIAGSAESVLLKE